MLNSICTCTSVAAKIGPFEAVKNESQEYILPFPTLKYSHVCVLIVVFTSIVEAILAWILVEGGWVSLFKWCFTLPLPDLGSGCVVLMTVQQEMDSSIL